MTDWSEKIDDFVKHGANPKTIGDCRVVNDFGDAAAEYESAHKAGLCDRSYRTIIEITGKDRADWLHNLTTNSVRELNTGDGNYSFAANVQGRILFDMNVLVDADRILLDIDRRWVERAQEHFNKYIIMEDVTLANWSESFGRLTVIGSQAVEVLASMTESNLTAAAQLQIVRASIAGQDVLLFKHDDIGISAVDLAVPQNAMAGIWDAIQSDSVAPIGYAAIDAIRMEFGIPWPVTEIHDDVLPAETGLFDRAVSYRKGCYLGQEIIERMRSRNVQAKKLVIMTCDAAPENLAETNILSDNKSVGVVTSACPSPMNGKTIAMGYVRSESADTGQELILEKQSASGATVIDPRDRPSH